MSTHMSKHTSKHMSKHMRKIAADLFRLISRHSMSVRCQHMNDYRLISIGTYLWGAGGHNYTGYNYIGHDYIGHNYTDHDYIGHANISVFGAGSAT